MCLFISFIFIKYRMKSVVKLLPHFTNKDTKAKIWSIARGNKILVIQP